MELESADGDVPPPPAKVRTGEFDGMMLGLRWARAVARAAG